MYQLCGNRGEVIYFESMTKKRSSEILADKRSKILLEKGKFEKFIKHVDSERRSEIVESETGGNASMPQREGRLCLQAL